MIKTHLFVTLISLEVGKYCYVSDKSWMGCKQACARKNSCKKNI